MHMIHWVFFFKTRREEELERVTIASPENRLVTHGKQRRKQINNASHTAIRVEGKASRFLY